MALSTIAKQGAGLTADPFGQVGIIIPEQAPPTAIPLSNIGRQACCLRFLTVTGRAILLSSLLDGTDSLCSDCRQL